MTAYANTFEGGTSGTTINTGNSGGTSGDAWDVVTIGSGATFAFDNAHAAHGTLAGKVATGAGSTTVLISKTFPGATTTPALRLYCYFTANPAAASWNLAEFRSGTTLRLAVFITSTGKVRLLDAASGTVFTSTNSITLNAWVRIEVYSVTLNSSTGAATIALFNSPDSSTATESSSVSSANFGGSADRVSYGITRNATANVGPFWLDDVAENDTGTAIGPAGGADTTATPAEITATATIDTPTVTATATPTPATITATAAIGTPTVTATATVTPTTLLATATYPSPTVTASGQPTPTTIGATATIGVPAVITGTIATPTTLLATATYPAPSITASGKAAPATITATATFGTPTARADTTRTPTTILATASIPTPVITATAVATPSTILAVATFTGPVIGHDGGAAPTTLLATATYPTPAISVDVAAVRARVTSTVTSGTRLASSDDGDPVGRLRSSDTRKATLVGSDL